MKYRSFIVILIIFALLIGACSANKNPNTSADVLPDNKPVSEVNNLPVEDEISDQNDNADGNSSEPEDVSVPPTEEFDPDYPSEGNWLVTYNISTLVCGDDQPVTFPASEPEYITITLGEESQIFITKLFNQPETEYNRIELRPGGAVYAAANEVDGISFDYLVNFVQRAQNSPYNWFEGLIESEEDDCLVTRRFFGQPLE